MSERKKAFKTFLDTHIRSDKKLVVQSKISGAKSTVLILKVVIGLQAAHLDVQKEDEKGQVKKMVLWFNDFEVCGDLLKCESPLGRSHLAFDRISLVTPKK